MRIRGAARKQSEQAEPEGTSSGPVPAAAPERPDVFLSYAREDSDFVEHRLTPALVTLGKDVWIDVEDIRRGASDWRAGVWAGIESATVMVFVLTPDSLASTVCGEELERADELNKRIIPILRRSVDGLPVPPALERPNWIFARPEDDFETSVTSLVEALELDEAWVERHARLAQRTGEWLRQDRDGSYLLRGSDLSNAERWLDDAGAHQEAPTAEQITYITASRRASARRQRGLLTGVASALVVTAALAIVALALRERAIDGEKTALAQARAAQSTEALSRDPEESIRAALEAVAVRADEPEALFALRRAVSTAGWTRILRVRESSGAGLPDVEFSEDGRRVATAGADGRVAVWNTRTGRRISLVAHPESVNSVQFTPDGRQLLTASRDGTARTWDSATGRQLHVFDTKSDDAWAATYGANGRRILTVSRRFAGIWDAASGKRLQQLAIRGSQKGTTRLSLDGRSALTSGKGGNALLWDVATGKQIAVLRHDGQDPLTSSLFNGNARRIATFYASGTFCVWDRGRERPRLCRPGSPWYDVDLSRDGRRVLRTAGDSTVEVWDVASGRRTVLRNGGRVSSAQFDRSGEYVVTGADDAIARVWRVRPQRLVSVLRGHTDGVLRARFSPDGTQVVTGSDDGSARLWPARPDTPIDPAWQRADSTAFSPNSRDVLVVQGGRRAVWNTETGRIVPLSGGILVTDVGSWPCGRAVGCSPWSRNGRLVAGANAKGGAVVWDTQTGAVTQYGKATGTVTTAAFSPNGSLLVVVDGDQRRARIWNVTTAQPGAVVPRGGAADVVIASAQFVGGSQRILTVDSDGNAQLSDLASGTSTSLRGNVLPPAVAASRDGRLVALGTSTGMLRVYSATGKGRPPQRAANAPVKSLAFDRAGDLIATGGQRGTTITWDARTLESTPLRAPGGDITSATFSPDGNLVLVTSGATTRLWDRTLPRVVIELPQTPDARAELSPDGSRIVIAGRRRLQVVRCDACAPLPELERRARSLLPAP